jgi:hypothetical protein
MVSDLKLVPSAAHPALVAISPETTLLYLIMAENTSEDDLTHVPSHGVFIQNLIGDLVDAHEHES